MMRAIITSLAGALVLITFGPTVSATDLKDQVRVEAESVGLHPGLDPGLYVCAGNHLHIKAIVENLSEIPLGKVEVMAKAFGIDDLELGATTAATKEPVLVPGGKAEVNLEFLTITGAMIEQVTGHELTVVSAPSL